MTYKQLLTASSLALLCSVSGLTHAGDEASVKLDRPGAGVKEFKAGDVVPDEYQRESLELKDWKIETSRLQSSTSSGLRLKGNTR